MNNFTRHLAVLMLCGITLFVAYWEGPLLDALIPWRYHYFLLSPIIIIEYVVVKLLLDIREQLRSMEVTIKQSNSIKLNDAE